ncbi:MAG TPA: hypothetical protein GXX46_06010 [Peptococcaceae bacterium]|nr:hypothetical protein [Peptococcaceae bacterium]
MSKKNIAVKATAYEVYINLWKRFLPKNIEKGEEAAEVFPLLPEEDTPMDEL